MITKLRMFALLLLLTLGVAGVVYAQGFGDDGQPPSQSSDAAAPTAQVQQQYADGKVIGVVQTVRPYGYRIGEPIPVQVIFVTDPGVIINVDGIMQGNFDPNNGSDFELAAQPTMRHFQQKGKEVYIIDLKIRTWKIDPTSALSCVFLYATETLPDGKPNYQPATLPDFVLSRSNTAVDASKDLDPGDLSAQNSPHPTPVLPMRILGGLLLLIPLGWLTKRTYRHFFPPRVVPANELAWATFDRILKESDSSGVSYARTNLVAGALRAYLGLETLPSDKARPALETFFAKHEQRFELARVSQEALSILDKALYERPEDESTIALSARDTRELFARIERVVPRP